jgi:ribosomal protein S18 acetylase RimI-like enzyme
MNLIVKDEISSDNYDFLVEKIISYNEQNRISFSDEINLPFQILIEIEDKIIGGVFGRSHWGTLEIKTFIIDELYRQKGIGSSLLNRAIILAKERKCDFISLDTYSFQAPEFYLKNGFEIIGMEENPKKGFTKFYMRKTL